MGLLRLSLSVWEFLYLWLDFKSGFVAWGGCLV